MKIKPKTWTHRPCPIEFVSVSFRASNIAPVSIFFPFFSGYSLDDLTKVLHWFF